MSKISIVFMGTPEFAVPTLKALVEAGCAIKAVYTQPPRPVGRGYEVRPSAVHQFAVAQDLKVLTPASLKDPEVQAEFKAHQVDFAVVAAYGLILPAAVLAAPRYGCINVHASLLPRWRGAAPIQRALLAGDTVTGVTIMQMEQGLDTGPMIQRAEVAIDSMTTSQMLYTQLAQTGSELIVSALDGLLTGRLISQPQPEEGVTHAAKISKEDGRLCWTQPADFLERQVRALMPWPGAYFQWQGQAIKVLKAAYEPMVHLAPPGTLLDEELLVACGEGALRLLELQRPGKTPLQAKDFLNGAALSQGMKLGA